MPDTRLLLGARFVASLARQSRAAADTYALDTCPVSRTALGRGPGRAPAPTARPRIPVLAGRRMVMACAERSPADPRIDPSPTPPEATVHVTP